MENKLDSFEKTLKVLNQIIKILNAFEERIKVIEFELQLRKTK